MTGGCIAGVRIGLLGWVGGIERDNDKDEENREMIFVELKIISLNLIYITKETVITKFRSIKNPKNKQSLNPSFRSFLFSFLSCLVSHNHSSLTITPSPCTFS
mgnify:CR=1 FL=1|jgi:hypothetical protein